jgi:hypothetical protein
VANLGLIFAGRAWRGGGSRAPVNGALWAVTGGALAFVSVILAVPVLRGLFQFGRLDARALASSVGAGVISVGWVAVVRRPSSGRSD